MIFLGERIRVLQVMGGLDRGGAEAMIMNIYRNIDRTQVQFDFVVNEREKPYAFESEIKSLGGKVYSVPEYNGINVITHRNAWRSLFESNHEWEILHAHYTSSAFLFMNIAKNYNLKTIAHSHISGMSKSINSYIKVVTRFPLRFQSDYLLACTDEAASWMFGSKSNQTKILYNAIETDKYIFNENIRANIRKKLDITNQTVIGHVGRFADQKNHSFLIDIFYEYYRVNPNSILLLIGEGPLKLTIETKVNSLGIKDNVKFIGTIDNVHDYLQAMDIFIFPSLYEGLGMVAIEAQTAGLPIIASTNVPKEAEITNLITFLSLEYNASDWAQQIDNSIIYNRENMQEEVIKAGYDIKDTSLNLQKYYLNIINEDE